MKRTFALLALLALVASVALGQVYPPAVKASQLTPTGTGVATSPVALVLTASDAGIDGPGCGSTSNPCRSGRGLAAVTPKFHQGPVKWKFLPGNYAGFVVSGYTLDLTTWTDAGYLDAGFSIEGTMAIVTDAGGTMSGTISGVTNPAQNAEFDISVLGNPFVADSLEGMYFCDSSRTKPECKVIRANDAGMLTTATGWPFNPVAGDSFEIDYPTSVIDSAFPLPFGLGTPPSVVGGVSPPSSTITTEILVENNSINTLNNAGFPAVEISNMAFHAPTNAASAAAVIVQGSTQTLGLENVAVRLVGTSAVRVLEGAKLFAYNLSAINNNAIIQCSGMDTNGQGNTGCGTVTIAGSVLKGTTTATIINQQSGGNVSVYRTLLRSTGAGTGWSEGSSLAGGFSVDNHYVSVLGTAVVWNGQEPFSFETIRDTVLGADRGYIFAGKGEVFFSPALNPLDTATTALAARFGAQIEIASNPTFIGAGTFDVDFTSYPTSTVVSGADSYIWSSYAGSVIENGHSASERALALTCIGNGFGNTVCDLPGAMSAKSFDGGSSGALFTQNVQILGTLTVGGNAVDNTPAENNLTFVDSFGGLASTGDFAVAGFATTSATTLRGCVFAQGGTLGVGTNETIKLCDTAGCGSGTIYATCTVGCTGAAGTQTTCTTNTAAIAAAKTLHAAVTAACSTTDSSGALYCQATTP